MILARRAVAAVFAAAIGTSPLALMALTQAEPARLAQQAGPVALSAVLALVLTLFSLAWIAVT